MVLCFIYVNYFVATGYEIELGSIHGLRGLVSWFLWNTGQALIITWGFNSPSLNADSEFAVTALSEGFSAQVILTWSLQVTALSEG